MAKKKAKMEPAEPVVADLVFEEDLVDLEPAEPADFTNDMYAVEPKIGKPVPRKKTKEELAEYDRRSKVFGLPEWVEVTVLPMGERGAKLWRQLQALWKDDWRRMKKDWDKISPDVKNWK